MKFLTDFFPIVLFFTAYYLYGIYVATAVAIAASIFQVIFVWVRTRKFETMHLVTMGILIVFGGATLILQDEMFIKWKPSVINWLFGVVFFASQFIGEKTIIERMMSQAIDIPAPIWIKLNTAWSLFFISVGFVNLYVVYNYDTDTWVNFKLFGMLGLTFTFVILQSLYLAKYIKDDDGNIKPVDSDVDN
ncbi:MAG: septation protein A [Methylococcales bacterium]|jgi:intracellular septation protein|nr:septation protein A [Methylococcales bacterium]MBT7408927.1 septation protein A [Methylococcales bacterium]